MADKVGRVALITGCGKAIGIGGASARALAEAGIKVAVSDVAPAGAENDNAIAAGSGWRGLDSLVEMIAVKGGEAAPLVGDVSVEADANRLVAQTIERFGRLDILVNNAGAPHGGDRGESRRSPSMPGTR